jgi:glutathione peroxidase
MKMKKIFLIISVIICTMALLSAFILTKKTIYDFSVKDIDGNNVQLSKYKGKTVLIVNVASKCGLTPQYKDLEEIYKKYKVEGLEILAFPANDFMNQEPGTNEEIKQFCQNNYQVSFTVFSKISVQGKDMHPLYKYLTKKTENGFSDAPVKWNFQKFLIGKNGKLLEVFKPGDKVNDSSIEAKIVKALK